MVPQIARKKAHVVDVVDVVDESLQFADFIEDKNSILDFCPERAILGS